MTEKTKIDLLQHMKVGEEILINDVRQILLHFNAEKRIVYVKDVKSIDGASIKVDLSEVSFLPKEDKSYFFQKFMTLTASLSLSSISAFMTIVGFMHFFFLNQLIIGFLFGAIELVKFVSATIVFNNEGISKHHKIGLFLFLSVLIVISTIGHYSYLSQSYFSNKQTAYIKIDNIQENKKLLSSTIIDLENNNKRLESEVLTIPEKYKTLKRNTLIKNNKKIKENSERIISARNELRALSSNLEKEKYVSAGKSSSDNTLKVFGTYGESFAVFLIFLLALIIDPLAFYFAYIFGTLKKKF